MPRTRDPGTPRLNELRIRYPGQQARTGDLEVHPILHEDLDADPELWEQYGDLAAHAQRSWIEVIGGGDMILRASLERKLLELKSGLSSPAASPLEVLLVERIAACWLQVWYADAAAAQVGNLSIKQADFVRKRQDSAHRRYLAAISTLAMVRRVAHPPIGVAGSGLDMNKRYKTTSEKG